MKYKQLSTRNTPVRPFYTRRPFQLFYRKNIKKSEKEKILRTMDILHLQGVYS